MQYIIKLKDERNGKARSEVLDDGIMSKSVSMAGSVANVIPLTACVAL